MLVDFDILPDDSRIWIYAAEQKLTNDKEDYILNQISAYLQNWEAHKVPLKAGVSILENHFIIVALDQSENEASGCSIDTLQNKIQDIESELSISLLNRLNIFCRIDNAIECMPTSQLTDDVDKETLFYDLTIQKKIELYNWLKPIKYGWCKKFLD
tara:strand:- start:230 stop:697 length:468 start_codon:yes stop_codon:yes gene_type:complete